MQTGTKISLLGHGALVTWALVGGVFRAEPLPFSVQEVSVISAAEFEQLSAQISAPDVAENPDVPSSEPPRVETPQTPSVSETPPVPPGEPDPLPEPPSQPVPDPVPEPPEPQPTPEVATVVNDLPEQVSDLAPVPEVSEPQVGQATDRVAPDPIAAPDPDVRIDDIAQEEIAPEEGAEDLQPAQEATAEEAASDRIVTEAEADDAERALALQNAPRPRSRPQRPQPEPADPEPQPDTQTAEQTDESAPEPQDSAEDINAALESLVGEAQSDVPSGPPLTAGEKDGLRLAVSKCWNVGSLSSEALRITVVVGVSLSSEGVPDQGSIRLLSSDGGSTAAANQAFQAARRAILRCGARGFDLPTDKYAQWRDIEMTFNPERMRIK